ncbi:MAG: tetratricopeptide repeat protein [Planctomycetes bacterium]|nr:tetratricopeptide repeat protein [Planctomycetota bacterium]
MMKRMLLAGALLLGLAPGGALAREERPVILRLTTGAEVSGVIPADGFDESRGVTLRRDDNGGVLRLRWDQIRDEDVVKIKRMYGYEGDELPPIQMQALEVRTATGSLLGLDAGREEGFLLLRKKDNVVRVPQESILSIKTVQVDALTVENPAQVFEHKKREADLERPVDWYNLGLIAETLTLWEQARTCFATVLELDPNFPRRSVLEQKLLNLDVKERETEQTDVLARVRSLKYRGALAEALALAEEFEEKWPDSLQLADVQKEKAQIAQAQQRAHQEAIRTDFFSILRRLAEEKGLDREVILGEAMTWAKDQAYLDVQEKLAALYGITPEKVDELWESRGIAASPRESSYGGGTFILGEKAKENLEKGSGKEEEAKGEEKKEDDPVDLQGRIQQRLKEKRDQQAKKKEEVKQVGDIVDVPPSPEEWWTTALPKDRTAFLLAFFAENSGKVNVVARRIRDCSTCYGKGIQEFFARNDPNQEGEEGDVPCPRCKTLTFDRIVVFK